MTPQAHKQAPMKKANEHETAFAEPAEGLYLFARRNTG
jgi:hypothetical protein